MADTATEIDPAKLRNLKIKTGVVKRYTKEKLSYEKEAKMQEDKIVKFKEEGKDEYFMKQQVSSLQESELMIPDTQRRLGQAHKELKEMTTDVTHWGANEDFKNALQVLKEAEPHLPANQITK